MSHGLHDQPSLILASNNLLARSLDLLAKTVPDSFRIGCAECYKAQQTVDLGRYDIVNNDDVVERSEENEEGWANALLPSSLLQSIGTE